MTKSEFEKILACPKCKTSLNLKKGNNICPKCKFKYSKENNIWNFLYLTNKLSKLSKKVYEEAHSTPFIGPNDGSYEILASFAKGNKTVDIACGQGHIEKLAPETIAVEFSKNALLKAKKAGVKNLVLADAHSLPFKNDSFDIAISSGNLEHFANPQKAILEMARVSKIQIIVVHTHPRIPFANILHKTISAVFNITHQPIETPITKNNLKQMLAKANLHPVYDGYWNLPVNYGKVVKFLPEFKNIPSCLFVISIKK